MSPTAIPWLREFIKQRRIIMKRQFIFFLLASLLVLPLPVFGLSVGDKAPLFEAPSTRGTIRISDYLGKKIVILAFYFKDFTSG